jgi:peptidoglycan-associated lipoprotein
MVTVAGFGCAHQQPPPAKATALATHPAPVVHASAPAPQPSSPAGESYDAGKAAKDAVYFDFDSSLLRDDARPTLQKVADVARKRDASVRIEGNCDELGTTEYNMALGDQRARQAKDYLVKLGVSASRIETVSYGSERPKADGHDDRAHAQNRRDDLILR